ncbi:L51 S25 CI-B8 domain containing protein [Trichuris trichiura]|uniref:Large ribosomal subunit protein mL43 n=1 Tax=Trichuris trichiura TaxID=36087 RepID=A0A077YUL5_TRITR|nr:L51 S25 CI-B8 domain containing protein [Trichuris trichiura]
MTKGKFRDCRIYAWRLSGYPKAVLRNGIGRFIHPLQRLTFFFCKSSSNSAGVRQFLTKDLVDFSTSHPSVAVYVQPKRFKRPWICGEYLNGRSASISVNGFSHAEVQQAVSYMASRSGFPIIYFKEPQTTHRPTIQGFWNPFYHTPTEMNVTSFPNNDLGRCKMSVPLASEILAQHFGSSSRLKKEPTSDETI